MRHPTENNQEMRTITSATHNTPEEKLARLKTEKSALNDFLILQALELNTEQSAAVTGIIGKYTGKALGVVLGALSFSFIWHSATAPEDFGSFLGKYAAIITGIPGAAVGLLTSPARMAQICATRTLIHTSDRITLFSQALSRFLTDLNSPDNSHYRQEPFLSEKTMLFMVFSLLVHDIIKSYGDSSFSTSASSEHLLDTLRKKHLSLSREDLSTFAKKIITYLSETETPFPSVNSTAHLKNQGKKLFNLIMDKLEIYGQLFLEPNDRTPEFSVENFTNDCIRKIFDNNDLFNYIYSEIPGALIVIAAHHLPGNTARIQEMIKENDYKAFSWAATNAYSTILERLIELAPDKVQEMIQADNYSIFKWTVYFGHMHIAKRLLTLAQNDAHNMLIADNYEAFHFAVGYHHSDITNWLLTFPSIFSYAEMHQGEYHELVLTFILEKINNVRTEQRTFESENPNAVFNITDPEEAKLLFYIARNIIRRNDRNFDNDLLFLLFIPAVRALAPIAVTAENANELIQLALTTRNQTAAEMLLNIPGVRELTAQNNYYLNEVRGRIDLRAIANDRESSIRALTVGEQRRLEAALKIYKPTIDKVGVKNLMQKFREQLIARYQKNPAIIKRGNQDFTLPFDWDKLKPLLIRGFNEEEKKLAFAAYYQHKDHTAFRYLSKPNHWAYVSENPAFDVQFYGHINPANRFERWSTFEEYQPLIVLFWLAAQDENIKPTDGITLEGRLEHFIDELAHIGRAHNWDKTRTKKDKNNNPVLDENRNEIKEEFDDGEGDDPSCFSGVMRRLNQSVIGHPLLKFLTMDDIKQELRDFVRGHFSEMINESNRAAMKDAWDEYIIETEFQPDNLLKKLDITPEKQENFIRYLEGKYGDQFSDDPNFKKYLTKEFTLEERDYAHALKFSAQSGLEKLLQPSSNPSAGLFGQPAQQPQKNTGNFCGMKKGFL